MQIFDKAIVKIVLLLMLNYSVMSQDKNCEFAPTCPVCPVIEEWPLDFDGDDLAEKAQLRRCVPNQNHSSKELIIIFDWQAKPIIYKSNSAKCHSNKQITFSYFRRYDFNQDHFDELIIVERNQLQGSEELKIIGYHKVKKIITELPLIEYEADLPETVALNLHNAQISFVKVKPPNSFILSLFSKATRQKFWIYYYQDLANSTFYPLELKEILIKKHKEPNQIIRP